MQPNNGHIGSSNFVGRLSSSCMKLQSALGGTLTFNIGVNSMSLLLQCVGRLIIVL